MADYMPRLLAALTIVSACAAPDDRITVEPARIVLDPMACGSETTALLTLHNPGDQPADVAISSALAGVTVAPAQTRVSPGRDVTVLVALTAPDTLGASAGALVVSSGGDNLAVPITMTSTGVTLAFDPPVLDFGEASPGTAIERTVTVSATGTAAAEVGFQVPSSAQYEVIDSPATIAPGASHPFAIRFRAGSRLQGYPATVTLAASEPVCGGRPVLGLVGAASDGVVVLDRTIVDFGDVQCRTSDVLALDIANHGETATTFHVRVDDPEGFFYATSLSGLEPAGTVAAGASARVRLAYRSVRNVRPGLAAGLIEVELGGGALVKTLPVRAVVQRPAVEVDERVIDLGDVPQGTSVTRSFDVLNFGNALADVTMFSSGELAISPLRLPVPAESERPVTVTFTASAPPGTAFETSINVRDDTCAVSRFVTVRARVVAN